MSSKTIELLLSSILPFAMRVKLTAFLNLSIYVKKIFSSTKPCIFKKYKYFGTFICIICIIIPKNKNFLPCLTFSTVFC